MNPSMLLDLLYIALHIVLHSKHLSNVREPDPKSIHLRKCLVNKQIFCLKLYLMSVLTKYVPFNVDANSTIRLIT